MALGMVDGLCQWWAIGKPVILWVCRGLQDVLNLKWMPCSLHAKSTRGELCRLLTRKSSRRPQSKDGKFGCKTMRWKCCQKKKASASVLNCINVVRATKYSHRDIQTNTTVCGPRGGNCRYWQVPDLSFLAFVMWQHTTSEKTHPQLQESRSTLYWSSPAPTTRKAGDCGVRTSKAPFLKVILIWTESCMWATSAPVLLMNQLCLLDPLDWLEFAKVSLVWLMRLVNGTWDCIDPWLAVAGVVLLYGLGVLAFVVRIWWVGWNHLQPCGWPTSWRRRSCSTRTQSSWRRTWFWKHRDRILPILWQEDSPRLWWCDPHHYAGVSWESSHSGNPYSEKEETRISTMPCWTEATSSNPWFVAMAGCSTSFWYGFPTVNLVRRNRNSWNFDEGEPIGEEVSREQDVCPDLQAFEPFRFWSFGGGWRLFRQRPSKWWRWRWTNGAGVQSGILLCFGGWCRSTCWPRRRFCSAWCEVASFGSRLP